MENTINKEWLKKSIQERIAWYEENITGLVKQLEDQLLVTSEIDKNSNEWLKLIRTYASIDHSIAVSDEIKGYNQVEQLYYQTVSALYHRLPAFNTAPSEWIEKLQQAPQDLPRVKVYI